MVLSSSQSRCESSPGSFDECILNPLDCRCNWHTEWYEARRGLGGAAARPDPSSLYQM